MSDYNTNILIAIFMSDASNYTALVALGANNTVVYG